ncbi:heparin lyase I family protein [Paraburkholderia sp. B3]|uniref:heparin lyase I family protein n=1 Tax=Paraburkholderia sp. B3 TaxID=3134791 RepID=UPI0039828494
MKEKRTGPVATLPGFFFVRCLMVFFLTTGCVFASAAIANSNGRPQPTLLFSADWAKGISKAFGVQANAGDLEVIPDPTGKFERVLRVTLNRSEDFAHVENGVPRGELLFPAPVRFEQGKEYIVKWSTLLPSDFEFDAKQLVIITQINQGHWLGGPTVALALEGAKYAISQHGGVHHEQVSAGEWLCCADKDKGRWVNWKLDYVSDETGNVASTRLFKDDLLVFDSEGHPNAYPGVEDSYFKIGLYKPDWNKKPTDINRISIFYGPVSIYVVAR